MTGLRLNGWPTERPLLPGPLDPQVGAVLDAIPRLDLRDLPQARTAAAT